MQQTRNLVEAGSVPAMAGEVEALAGKGLPHRDGVGMSGQPPVTLDKVGQALGVGEERAGWGHVLQVLAQGVSLPPLPHSDTPPPPSLVQHCCSTLTSIDDSSITSPNAQQLSLSESCFLFGCGVRGCWRMRTACPGPVRRQAGHRLLPA